MKHTAKRFAALLAALVLALCLAAGLDGECARK